MTQISRCGAKVNRIEITSRWKETPVVVSPHKGRRSIHDRINIEIIHFNNAGVIYLRASSASPLQSQNVYSHRRYYPGKSINNQHFPKFIDNQPLTCSNSVQLPLSTGKVIKRVEILTGAGFGGLGAGSAPRSSAAAPQMAPRSDHPQFRSIDSFFLILDYNSMYFFFVQIARCALQWRKVLQLRPFRLQCGCLLRPECSCIRLPATGIRSIRQQHQPHPVRSSVALLPTVMKGGGGSAASASPHHLAAETGN